jgi:hypothetical protein
MLVGASRKQPKPFRIFNREIFCNVKWFKKRMLETLPLVIFHESRGNPISFLPDETPPYPYPPFVEKVLPGRYA